MEQNNTKVAAKIIGKMVIQANVTNETNLLIASGLDEQYDFEVVRDSNNNPFIPGSSFAGMLRSHFEKYINLDSYGYKLQSDYLWGSRDNKIKDKKEVQTFQSHLIIDDLFSSNDINTNNRDGVYIDYCSGIADNKYDYEFVPPGASFKMNMEVTLREGCDVEMLKSFIKFIVQEGENKKYFQGAFSTHSFGQLSWSETKILYFDFIHNKNQDANKWFSFLENPDNINLQTCNLDTTTINLPEVKQLNVVTIKANFSIKHSFIISSPNFEIDNHTDNTHLLNAKGEPIITGKSIRGALRHRCYKILNSINKNETKNSINNLFGYVDPSDNTSKKGRFKDNETKIINSINKEQNRITICRLTGKTVDHALITEEVLQGGEFQLEFSIENCQENELFLLLLALKDMIHQDLPIGGTKTIGRGVLIGNSLSVNDLNGNYIKWSKENPRVDYSEPWKKILTTNLLAN